MTRVAVRAAGRDADYELCGTLIREYLASLPFRVDFQYVEDELADLRSEYGSPRGRALLGDVDDEAAGFVGVRAFAGTACEMKRMWVRPAHRGAGLGRRLAVAAVDAGRTLGYERMLLDTLRSMEAANALYESLGFRDVAAYRFNPLPDARYLALDLRIV